MTGELCFESFSISGASTRMAARVGMPDQCTKNTPAMVPHLRSAVMSVSTVGRRERVRGAVPFNSLEGPPTARE